jgi:hypothetical protein
MRPRALGGFTANSKGITTEHVNFVPVSQERAKTALIRPVAHAAINRGNAR